MHNPFDQRSLRRTACHEASHAVAAVVLNIPFEKVRMLLASPEGELPDRLSLGNVCRSTDKPSLAGQPEKAKVQLIQMFAGPIGETMAEPNFAVDWSQDADDVESVLRFAFCPFEMAGSNATFNRTEVSARRAEMDAFAKRCKTLAQQLVIDHSEAISRVAHALLERGELSCEEVETFCATSND